MTEFARIVEKLQHNIQFPAARGDSRLLPLLPASTMSYAALPNYGEVARQVLKVFREELQESAALRDWWTHGELASDGPKIEDALERVAQVHDYLGEEIVMSGAFEGKEPKFLAIAEVRKPGLKKFLEQMIAQLSGKSKPGVRVLDLQELDAAQAKSPNEDLLVLVRPDFLVAASELATLRSFNAQLDHKSREFAATPFGQRVAQEYQGGVTVLAAADLQKIVKQTTQDTPPNPAFARSGFADVKYFVWEHKDVGADTISKTELSFANPRRGAAAWLGRPGPMGSLDFVSPKTMAALSLVLSNPAQIFDDIKAFQTTPTPGSNPFAALAAFEKALNLSVKDDLLNLLDGEITLELASLNPPQPAWRAVLGVKDAKHLQQTLSAVLAAGQIKSADVVDGEVAYHTVQIPSDNKVNEIGYGFVDGYLVIGSSRDAVADAVHLHRSGGSLRKSERFLASLPPGRSVESSGLVYEDPIAMAALQMRRFAPTMAESFAQTSGETSPAVMSLYGDATTIREASRSGALDVGAMLVVAAVAIPNLVRSRVAANEASAVGSLRTVNTAQVTYAATYPDRGYARDLATLGTDPQNPAKTSESRAGFINETLANDSCLGTGWCVKSGYRFTVKSTCLQQNCADYVVVATPVDSNSGTRSFCSTSSGVIRWKMGGPLSVPVGLAECRGWSPVQ